MFRQDMSLATAIIIEDQSSPLLEKSSIIQTIPDDSTLTSAKNFPLHCPQTTFSEETEESGSNNQDDDSESFSYEPVKKVKAGEQGYNMLDNNRGYNKGIIEEGSNSFHKILSPSTQAENPSSVERRSRKDYNESLSGYNSSSSSELVVEKEVIEEEDNFDFPEIDSTDLIVEDEAIVDFRKAKEQVLKQAMLKNGNGGHFEATVHRQASDLNPMAYLANQAMRLNQFQQFNQRNFINQSLNYPFGNVAAVAMASQLQQIKAASYYYMQMQAQQQLQSVGWQNMGTILGKRSAYYEGRPLIDLESESKEQLVRDKINQKKPIFIIERNVRPKKETKKVIFNIIRTKPKLHKPKKAERPKKLSLLTDSLNSQKTVITENKSIENSINFPVLKIEKKINNGENKNKMEEETPIKPNKNLLEEKDEKSKKKQEAKLEKKETVELPKTNKKAKKNDDSYIIKLHVDEEDDDEDIADTPVGDEFQANVGPFKKQTLKKRPLKLVWDPSQIEEKTIKTFYQKVEAKFDKTIINQEFALKAFKENRMNVRKVIGELENNKVLVKNFFEIRQKVLRNRVLPHDF